MNIASENAGQVALPKATAEARTLGQEAERQDRTLSRDDISRLR
jgi:hypothetical protein